MATDLTAISDTAPLVRGLDASWPRPPVPGLVDARLAAGRGRAAKSPQLDLAVIGCGAVVERLYRRPLRKLESKRLVRVVALVDRDAARAATLAREFPDARVFPTPGEAFRHAGVDLSIVTSPPGFHAEHAVAAFEHGSHVLCEKPLAVRVEDAETMVTAARQAGRVLAAGMTRRFYPCFAEARRLLTDGVLGDDLRFVYREGDVYGWPASTAAPFRRATAGGGVLMDMGSHVVDSLVGLFGAPAVEGYEDDALRDGVEANCRLRLAFPTARGVVQLSWNQPLASGLHVMGSAGELRLDLVQMDRLLLRRGSGPWETVVSRHGWPADLAAPPRRRATPRSYHDCVSFQLVQVLRAVAHGDPVPVDGGQALLTVRAIDDCYRRARPLALPWLSTGEQAAASALHWSQAA